MTTTALPPESYGPQALVVEDEGYISSLVAEILRQKLKARVDCAMNGQEAIKLLKLNTYDLIVSDIRMPVMDGGELLKWLQHFKPGQLKGLFFMTGQQGSLVDIIEIVQSNLPILRKPFSIDAFLSQCHHVLQNGGK